jgi:hypothetical protein
MLPQLVVMYDYFPGVRYARFEGRMRTHLMQASKALSPVDVETFRTTPADIYPDEAPEAA